MIAPLAKGQAVGTLKISSGDQPLLDVPLVALEAVEQAGVLQPDLGCRAALDQVAAVDQRLRAGRTFLSRMAGSLRREVSTYAA